MRSSVRASVRLSVRPSKAVRPSVRPSARPSVRPYAGPSARPSVRPSCRPPASPSAPPSVRRSVLPSVRPSAIAFAPAWAGQGLARRSAAGVARWGATYNNIALARPRTERGGAGRERSRSRTRGRYGPPRGATYNKIALAYPLPGRWIEAGRGATYNKVALAVPPAGRGGAADDLQQYRARSPGCGACRVEAPLPARSRSRPRGRDRAWRGGALRGGGARRGGARLTTRSRSRVRGRSGAGRSATDPARAPASDADRAGGHGLWAQYLRASGRHGQGREVVACVLRLLLSKEQRVCGDSQEPRARCACLELSRGVWSAYQAQTSQHASWGNENCSSLRGCHDLAGIGVTRSLGGRGPTGKLFWGKRASPDNSAQVL